MWETRKRPAPPDHHLAEGGGDISNDIPLGLCQCGCGRVTTIARWNNKRCGYIAGQPKKYVAGHYPRRLASGITVDDYVIEDRGHETPCWIWVFPAQTGAGYARVVINGQTYLAHRAMYEQEVGPIPDGLTIDHLCNVKACVNPAHLEAVTLQENIRRRDVMLRARKHI